MEGREIHLKNNAGLDFLKGKDLIVVGKFDLPESYYQRVWEDMGNDSKVTKNNCSIYYNNILQHLYLFEDEELRAQQLEYMEYTTAQAVGRARSLRTDATVYVFSNYVIKDTDIVYD